MNTRLGPITRLLSPGLSWCGRCKTTWRFVTPHITVWRDGSGCFPLCEKCWAHLTIEQRIRYYRRPYDEWGIKHDRWPTAEDLEVWWQIAAAVRAGK